MAINNEKAYKFSVRDDTGFRVSSSGGDPSGSVARVRLIHDASGQSSISFFNYACILSDPTIEDGAPIIFAEDGDDALEPGETKEYIVPLYNNFGIISINQNADVISTSGDITHMRDETLGTNCLYIEGDGEVVLSGDGIT